LFSKTLGGAVGPPMADWTFDVTGSYRMVFLVLAGLTLIGFGLLMVLQPVPGCESSNEDWILLGKSLPILGIQSPNFLLFISHLFKFLNHLSL